MLHRYIQVNDVHLSDQPPSGRTASYLDDILAKLEWCMEYADAERATVVITGDLFHRKNAAHTTHRTVQRVREILAWPGKETYIVPGNHDEAHGGGLDGQPLLSVVDDRRIRLLEAPAEELLDPYIAGISWSNEFEGVNGVAAFVAECASVDRPLIFTHAPISLRPYPFGPEAQGWLLAADLVPLLPDHVRLVAHGHMHNGHKAETWRVENDGEPTHYLTFSNPGALARASLSTDDVARRPMVADITYDDATQAVEVRYVEVECARPAADVLRLEQHAREARRDGSVEALAASLAGAEAEVVDADVMRAHLRSLVRPETIAEDVWERGLALADAALDGVEG